MGVQFKKSDPWRIKRYRVDMKQDRKRVLIGYFYTKEEATKVYNIEYVKFYGYQPNHVWRKALTRMLNRFAKKCYQENDSDWHQWCRIRQGGICRRQSSTNTKRQPRMFDTWHECLLKLSYTLGVARAVRARSEWEKWCYSRQSTCSARRIINRRETSLVCSGSTSDSRKAEV